MHKPFPHSPTSKLPGNPGGCVHGDRVYYINTKQTTFIARVNVGLYFGEEGVISKFIH